ncbi:hypothetical protein P152DRAFT_89038 [Eremomyces bilateralis CBS 781.70]|uniref:Uncharacterized protein n=1 Tax=Eremomyces bilateralis CBS 781.70 TaxID=1392243 RepID=A0A6G1FXZ4_9PEZI|nr:uncharacterized protein P152DRAFT_89038 [Eremomyces bilateralis CBS 781.70]KAF1810560.1 hypothetical protein P152DRAFT_89038 [Eremomyces bilateralis CBS 781.70]
MVSSKDGFLGHFRHSFAQLGRSYEEEPSQSDQVSSSSSTQSLPLSTSEIPPAFQNIDYRASISSNVQRYSDQSSAVFKKAKAFYHRKHISITSRLQQGTGADSDDELTDLSDPTRAGSVQEPETPSQDSRIELPRSATFPSPAPKDIHGREDQRPTLSRRDTLARLRRHSHLLPGRSSHSSGDLRRLLNRQSDGGLTGPDTTMPQRPQPPGFVVPRNRDRRPRPTRQKTETQMRQRVDSKLAMSPERPPVELPTRALSTSSLRLKKLPSLGFSFEPKYKKWSIDGGPLSKKKTRSMSNMGHERVAEQEGLFEESLGHERVAEKEGLFEGSLDNM